MIYNDDPLKGNRKEKTTMDNSYHTPEDPKKEKDEDKFSPGEPDDYNAEEFSTD